MNLGPFHFGAISLPFLGSATAVLVMGLYLLMMRGAPLLRGAFLGVVVGVVPLVVNSSLVSATNDEPLAIWLYRVALAPLPLAATCAMVFLLALAERLREHVRLVMVAALISLAAGVVALITPWTVSGVWRLPTGVLVQRGTLMSVLHVTLVGVQVGIGCTLVLRRLPTLTSAKRRRQCVGALIAFSLSTLAGLDVLLSFGIGWFPVSWFFMTIGPLVAIRSLVSDDLVHSRAVDRRVILGLPYLALVFVALWLIARGGGSPTRMLVEMLALFLLLRIALAAGQFFVTAEVATDSPLERAFERYAARVQTLRSEEELTAAAAEVLRLACGCERFAVVAAPDAATARRWREHAPLVLERDLVSVQRAELHAPLERLFATHDAEVLALLAGGDEVLGLMALGQLPGERALRPEELRLVARVADRLRDGLAHIAMMRDAHARAAVRREVGLAATVQEAFMPGRELQPLARVELAGGYEPATQCGGDWWAAHALPGGTTLVLVGDVTGHGLPAALLTAASRGCVDVVVRSRGARLELIELLTALDGVVRARGGDRLHMTCFATLIDPARKQVTFASAGHNVPYVVSADGTRLDVLPGRGDPLGAGSGVQVALQTRPVATGDLLVWYSDGLIECVGPDRQAWGDRRFQRALKKLGASTAGSADVGAIRDQLLAESAAFRAGVPADDDVTLVVARIR